MKCIIIEDQPPAQRILQKYIEDMGTLELRAVFSNALQALEFLKSEPIDLMFLDINLPRISGIDFLKSMQHPPFVIFTTAYSEYALESYELNVVDYLLKPFSFERFVKAVSKVPLRERPADHPRNPPQVREEIYVKSGYEHIRVLIADIMYIKADTDYTEIITQGKKYLSSEPLRYWVEVLDPQRFARSHKSYIVNSSKIDRLSGNRVILNDKTKIPIGRAYKEAFVKSLL